MAHFPEVLSVLEDPLCPPRSAPGPHPVILLEVVDQARRGWREQMAGVGQARESSRWPALSLLGGPGLWSARHVGPHAQPLGLGPCPYPPSLTKLWVQSGWIFQFSRGSQRSSLCKTVMSFMRTTEPCQPDRTHRAGAGMRARQVGERLAEAPRGPPPPPARPRPVPPRMWASSLPSVPSGVTGSTRADALPARTALPGVSAQTQPCV